MLLFFTTNMAAVTSYQPEISTLALTKAQSLVYSHGRIYYKSDSIQDDFSLFKLFFALIKPYVTYTGILVVSGDGFTYTVHLPRI